MQRLVKTFLTIAVVLIMAINLVMIVLYGRQFFACQTQEPFARGGDFAFCTGVSDSGGNVFLIVNIVVVLLLVIVWLAIRSGRHQSAR